MASLAEMEAKAIERRQDGEKFYSFDEFEAFYGQEQGKTKWESSTPYPTVECEIKYKDEQWYPGFLSPLPEESGLYLVRFKDYEFGRTYKVKEHRLRNIKSKEQIQPPSGVTSEDAKDKENEIKETGENDELKQKEKKEAEDVKESVEEKKPDKQEVPNGTHKVEDLVDKPVGKPVGKPSENGISVGKPSKNGLSVEEGEEKNEEKTEEKVYFDILESVKALRDGDGDIKAAIGVLEDLAATLSKLFDKTKLLEEIKALKEDQKKLKEDYHVLKMKYEDENKDLKARLKIQEETNENLKLRLKVHEEKTMEKLNETEKLVKSIKPELFGLVQNFLKGLTESLP